MRDVGKRAWLEPLLQQKKENAEAVCAPLNQGAAHCYRLRAQLGWLGYSTPISNCSSHREGCAKNYRAMEGELAAGTAHTIDHSTSGWRFGG